MTPRRLPEASSPYPALEAVRRLEARGQRPSERVWRAGCAERCAIEHDAMGLDAVAEAFRVQAARIIFGLPE